MLNDFLVSFTEQYHELGHAHPLWLSQFDNADGVNAMMDRVGGLGHRIEAGHDFSGLLTSCEIGGVPGVGSWFDHMLKDFTSHDGIPLPGAHAIEELTGMSVQSSLDWLCVNAADVLEVGLEAGALKLMERKRVDNPRVFELALALGGAMGIADDNPLVVAYTATQVARHVQSQYRVLSDAQAAAVSGFGVKLWRGVETGAVGTCTVVTALDLVGVDVLDWMASAGALLDGIDGLEGAGHIIDTGEAIIDGVASLGLGIVVGRLVRWAADQVNGPAREQIRDLTASLAKKTALRESLRHGASMPILTMLARDGGGGSELMRRLD